MGELSLLLYCLKWMLIYFYQIWIQRLTNAVCNFLIHCTIEIMCLYYIYE